MNILNLESGTPFSMGKGKNWSILNPNKGANRITLNHGLHMPGHEFPQHVHDESIDIIVVLEEVVHLRQGIHYTPLEAGDAAFIPAGEVHGTVNRSKRTARLISFQSPPDLALYRGERNMSDDKLPIPVEGTESKIEIIELRKGSPKFVSSPLIRNIFSPSKNLSNVRLDYISLNHNHLYKYKNPNTESVLVIMQGSALLTFEKLSNKLIKFDVVFLNSNENISLQHFGNEPTLFLHCISLL